MYTTDTTTNTSLYVYDFIAEPSWYLPIGIHVFLTISTLWLLFSLVHYGVKSGKWRKIKASNTEKLSAGMVYSSVIACAFMCLCRYSVAFVHMSVGFKQGESELCDALSDATSTFYTLVLLSAASFLWFRQRIFYTNEMLRVNYTFCVKMFSAASIVVVVIFGLAVLVFSTVLDDHPWSIEGCSYEPDGSLVIYYWISIVFAVGFGQISLLGLFVYALKKSCSSIHKPSFKMHSSRQNSEVSKSIETETEHISNSVSVANKNNIKNTFPPTNTIVYTNNQTKNASKIFNRSVAKKCSSSSVSSSKTSDHPVTVILRKTLLFAVISLLADILIQACSFYLVKDNHRRVVTTLFSINSFLNLLFLIFSFNQNKKMMMSPFYS